MITNFNNIQKNYIKRNILRSTIEGKNSYENILINCDGIFPQILNMFLLELIQEGVITQDNNNYYLTNNDTKILDLKKLNLKLRPLPNPHPKDFDWRFNESTINFITQILLKNTTNKDVILLLGVPSIANNIIKYKFHPKVIFIDINKIIIDHFNEISKNNFLAIRRDLLCEDINLDVTPYKVFFDPPWYIEYYIAFLLRLSPITEVGSKIFFSLPQINTRDNEYKNRWNILEITKKLGYSIKYIYDKKLEYITPDFEKRIIDDKIKESPWRKADLICITKYCLPNKNQIKLIEKMLKSYIKFDDGEWVDFNINNYKITIKGPFLDYANTPRLMLIDDEPYLNSVSRSYEKRSEIDLWFSDNRAFKISGRSAFLHALMILADVNVPEKLKINTKDTVDEALELLRGLF